MTYALLEAGMMNHQMTGVEVMTCHVMNDEVLTPKRLKNRHNDQPGVGSEDLHATDADDLVMTHSVLAAKV